MSKRVVGFGWRLLEFCYLNDQLKEHVIQAYAKMFPAKFEDLMIRGGTIVQTLKDINGEVTYFSQGHLGKKFLQALQKGFSFDELDWRYLEERCSTVHTNRGPYCITPWSWRISFCGPKVGVYRQHGTQVL